jgi:heptosyltransferase II
MAKILIIKLGYSETLDSRLGKVSSLGDVLRTTVVLHLFKEDAVTWLVDEKAYPLLKENKYIKSLLVYNNKSAQALQRQEFDKVVNFEKDSKVCRLSDSIKAVNHFGFRFDEETKSIHYYPGTEKAFEICNNIQEKKEHRNYWQEVIMEMAGFVWQGQEYILGYTPRTEVKYDIGLNWAVGEKWPNKAWPKEGWDKLACLIKDRYTYSWQKGLRDIYEYIDWINSCRLLVSADSLGQHIALALKKKVLILYGPTNPEETYLYGLGDKILPQRRYPCMPCLNNKCIREESCMSGISPQRVMNRIEELLGCRLKNGVNSKYG